MPYPESNYGQTVKKTGTPCDRCGDIVLGIVRLPSMSFEGTGKQVTGKVICQRCYESSREITISSSFSAPLEEGDV